MKLGLTLNVSQKQILAPQLIQSLKMVQAPVLQLEQMLRTELATDPMLDEIEELAYYSCYTAKVYRARCAAHLFCDSLYVHKCSIAVRIHILYAGRKNHVNADFCGHFRVALEISWVCLIIFVWAELGRIDKNAYYYQIVFCSGRPHQA